MNLDFLAVQDALLRHGASFGDGFRRLQCEFIRARGCADAGFRGRAGGSDPYYTDFAYRLLWLLEDGANLPAPPRCVDPPKDVVDVFSRVNVLRLCGLLDDLQEDLVREAIARQELGGGFYARPGDGGPSAYHTFIAWLVRAALGDEVQLDTRRLQAMRVEDGYLDTPGGSAPQTSATAAAAGVLLMAGERPDVAPFLLHMQAKDGGFLAHPAAPHSDLLSTYSAYLTLVLLGEEDAVDHGALGRFLRSTALAEGGFRSCPLDPEADVEYTFYGVAAIALLKARSA